MGAEYAAYLGLLQRRIQEAMRYPPVARRRGLTGTLELELVVGSDGAIEQATLVRSSSHRVLDEAALRAVRDLSRLPFPESLPARAVRARVPVVFELR